MVKALLALIPSIGVLFLFVVAIKAMLEGDRRERAAQAKWEKDHPPAASARPGVSR
ncbi:lysyl-tRNA synthetase [Angustibacter sp. McL0619]|uniref:lysyl-tRNA synthetase n=1 Tax=Angustibacter sp. McL0619 TaxID=3415676 RepID=UPI003CE89FE2